MKVLTFTHVFPRKKEDMVAPFLWNYHEALLSQGIEPIVLAPHDEGLNLHEQYDGKYPLYRFRYAPLKWQRIAYKGEMHELVFKNFLNKIIFLMFLISASWALFKTILKEKPDLIHVHWWIPLGLVTRFVTLFTRTPYVITTHGTDVFILKRFGFMKPFAKWVFGGAKRAHVISSYVGEIVADLIPKRKERIDTVSMPIRETDFPAIVPEFSEERSRKILGIGRLIERKGFTYLIDALNHLDATYSLTLVGSGSLRDALEQEVNDMSLQDRVTFVDGVIPSELPAFIEKNGVFVLPSITDWKGEKEGLGMVLLESIRCGLPVMASNSGGMTDIVVDGESGLLFEEKDSRGIAEGIKRLSDKEYYLKIAQGGQEHYLNNYSFESIAKRTLTSYEKATAK